MTFSRLSKHVFPQKLVLAASEGIARSFRFRLILLAFAVAGAGKAKAESVSVAEYIEDPGFELEHDANQVINTDEQKSVNGWIGLPKESSPFMSVSYVDADGKTLGDNQAAIVPAEGKSYLRMFTKNSWDWLSFTTGPFALVNGATYSISFKVAADAELPMSKLNVGLRDRIKGQYHGLTVYDLTTIEPGWNTIVYRFRYEGPDQPGVLQITGRREKSVKAGSLNFDDFKTAADGEQTRVKYSMVPEQNSAK